MASEFPPARQSTVSGKQRQAMSEAGVGFVYLSVYDMAYGCVRALLTP